MKISKAVQYALDYHRANSRENTVRSCEFVLSRFEREFEGKDLDAVNSDDVLDFLSRYTEGTRQSTKRSRCATLSAFFTLIQTSAGLDLNNPCCTPMLRKLFRPAKAPNWKILEKETVDEIIFRTSKPRNRIMLAGSPQIKVDLHRISYSRNPIILYNRMF